MTVGLAAAAVNSWLDTLFATASCFVKLHTADPGSAGGTAAAGGSTVRVQATMAAAAAGAKAMTSMASTWTNGGTPETLSHLSFWTAASSGTFNGSAALTSPQAWVSTNTFTLSSLSIAITPIAA